jgi:hypothetical protein
MYFIPVVAIIAGLAYVVWYKAQINKAVAAGHGPIMFHNSYAGTFSSLASEEYIIALWQGLAYTGSQSAAGQVGSAVANEIAAKAIGVSKYTPQVFVVLTSHGRLLVAEEFSEMGTRGNFKEVHIWTPGASAVVGTAAVPGHQGPPPSNPFNPSVTLELAQLRGPDGAQYACWLSPQSLEVTGQQRSVSTVLPMAPEAAASVWNGAVQQAQPTAT